jgi:hypothetical protein
MPYTITAQVPPPLGPPLAGAADIPLKKIKFSSIIAQIEEGLNAAMVNTNQEIKKGALDSNLQAKLSAQMMAVMPSYGETKFVTQPNQKIVQLRIKLNYTLSNISFRHSSYPSQKLTQQILITISCDKWNTDTGKSKISYVAEMPQSNGPLYGIAELDTLINNKLASIIYNKLCHALSKGAEYGELLGENFSCNCLSFKMGTGPVFSDGYAGFYYLPVRKMVVENLYSNPTIRLLSIERLSDNGEAELMHGSDMQVNYMANYATNIAKLRGFKENEKILHRKLYDPIEFEHPSKYNQLLIIANLTILDDAKQTLTGFLQFDKTQKYGEGLQKLTILKKELTPVVVSPNDPPITPAFKWVPAYILVFEINYKKKQ